MGDGIIDLDAMRPEKQVIVIANKEIDTSLISFGIILTLIDKMEDLGDGEDSGRKNTKRMLSVFGEIIDDILKEADNAIDDKWIKKHIGGFQKMMLIDKVITPLLDNVTKGSSSTKKKRSLM